MFSKLSLTSNSPRFGHESLISPKFLNVLLFGGSNDDGFVKYVEVLSLNSLTTRKISIEHPAISKNDSYSDEECEEDEFKGVAAFRMVSLSNDLDSILIFGGISENKKFSNQLMFLDDFSNLKSIQVSGTTIPSARIGHSFTKINKNKIILFGGVEMSSSGLPHYQNDLYILHISDDLEAHWERIEVSQPPSPRESHSAVLYRGNKIIIFGGMNGKERLNDTWILDVETLTFSEPHVTGTHPIGRSLHSATISNNEMFIFGGFIYSKTHTWTSTNSLQCLNLSSMSWRSVTGHSLKPPPRASHTAFEHLGRIYFYGGRKDLPYTNDIEVHNDCWFIDIQPPPPVSNLRLSFIGNDFIFIRWNKTPNTNCYLVEIQVVQEVKKVQIIKMEVDELMAPPPPPTKILVQPKKELEPVVTKKAKIFIHEHKILNLLQSPKTTIPQIDGATDDDDHLIMIEESDTESEQETSTNKWWCLAGIVSGEEKFIIRNYQDYTVNRRSITSEKLPKKMFNQISVKPKKKYLIRVSSLNSYGISDANLALTVKTLSMPPISCLRLVSEQNNKYFTFTWMTSSALSPEMRFNVVLTRMLPMKCSNVSLICYNFLNLINFTL